MWIVTSNPTNPLNYMPVYVCFSMMVVCFQKVVKLRQNAGCLLIMILGKGFDLIYLIYLIFANTNMELQKSK